MQSAENPTQIISRLRIVVPFMEEIDIEQQARILRAEYERAVDTTAHPFSPENLIWEFLDPRDRLSLDTEADLGVDKNGQRIAGSMAVVPPGGMISIDREFVGKPLYPFTLAHEIGHWILHRTYVQEQLSQGTLFDMGDNKPRTASVMLHTLRSVVMDEEGPSKKSNLLREEWQANAFARHLLMPEELVRCEFILRLGRHPIDHKNPNQHRSRDQRIPHLSSVREMARYAARYKTAAGRQSLTDVFDVSQTAMAIRLEQLGLVF